MRIAPLLTSQQRRLCATVQTRRAAHWAPRVERSVPEHVPDAAALNDTSMRFSRGLRDAFPRDYETSAVESPEPPRVTRTEFVQLVVGSICVVGLLLWAWVGSS